MNRASNAHIEESIKTKSLRFEGFHALSNLKKNSQYRYFEKKYANNV